MHTLSKNLLTIIDYRTLHCERFLDITTIFEKCVRLTSKLSREANLTLRANQWQQCAKGLRFLFSISLMAIIATGRNQSLNAMPYFLGSTIFPSFWYASENYYGQYDELLKKLETSDPFALHLYSLSRINKRSLARVLFPVFFVEFVNK